nr:hypothetical protein [Janibacter terrae]
MPAQRRVRVVVDGEPVVDEVVGIREGGLLPGREAVVVRGEAGDVLLGDGITLAGRLTRPTLGEGRDAQTHQLAKPRLEQGLLLLEGSEELDPCGGCLGTPAPDLDWQGGAQRTRRESSIDLTAKGVWQVAEREWEWDNSRHGHLSTHRM